MKKLNVLLICLLAISHKQHAQNLNLNFVHVVDQQKLILDSTIYENQLGQAYTVSKFKYYLSNFRFKNITGNYIFVNKAFLIDEDEPDTKNIMLNLPSGNYSEMEFIIGVDSLHNCSGAQSGALDPVNAMFWAWNTGYIFMKLEGTSSYSKAPGNFFEYHIGGYKQPTNCIRKISLHLNNFELDNTTTHTLNIKADVSEILKNPTSINFEKLPSITDASNSLIIANNYQDIFSVLIK